MSAPTTATPAAAPAEGAPANAAEAAAPAVQNAAQVNHYSGSLYCGDLLPDVSEAQLFEVFSQAGSVQSIRVLRDKITRRSLGYAYINFHTPVDAERALDSLNYTPIKGQPCRLMWCHRDPSLRKNSASNIFIKNLHPSIDNRMLFDTFSHFGNILSCKVEQEERNGESVSKGYGFVHFETQKAADDAIAKVNGMLLEGKAVYVGPFLKKSDRNQDEGSIRFSNVYVKNIDENVSEEDLKKAFAEFGTISSCVVMKNHEGASRGFGFVNFEKPEDAKAAVEKMNGQKLGEKEIYCGRAQKKDERSKELRGRYEMLRQERITKNQGLNLYVKNLDEEVQDDDLRSAFEEYGSITSARVMRDEKGATKGFGFVCFSNTEEATKAVNEMNGKMLKNKPLYVALAQRREVRRAHLEAQHQSRNGRVMPQNGMYTAGAPMFYPPNAMGGQPNFMYPQMVNRPRWAPNQAGGQQPNGRPMYQPVPYAVQVNQRQPRQPRRNGPNGAPQQPGQGRPVDARAAQNPNGARGPNGAPQAARGNQKFKFNDTARNKEQAAQPAAPAAGAAPAAAPADASQVSASSLADMSVEERRTKLGGKLYPLVARLTGEALAGKITGMLLGMDTAEVLNLLESSKDLEAKVKEATAVLEKHNQQASQ